MKKILNEFEEKNKNARLLKIYLDFIKNKIINSIISSKDSDPKFILNCFFSILDNIEFIEDI